MEIFVKCPCGSRYNFTEEPVNGRLRFPVKCTNCGADGTAAANEYIRKSLSGELELEEAKTRVWYRKMFQPKNKDSIDSHNETTDKERKPNVWLGGIAAIVAGIIGMCIWYYLGKITGRELKIVAWGVGVMAGLGARLFVPNGTFSMASVAAFSALLAIMGGQYLVLRAEVDEMVKVSIRQAYHDTVQYAKRGVAAESDDDVRDVLAEFGTVPKGFGKGTRFEQRYILKTGWIFSHVMKEDSAPTFGDLLDAEEEDALSISDEAVADFREHELPELKGILAGKPSRAEFEESLRDLVHSNLSMNNMVVQTWQPYTLLWLILGVGSAYRLAYNRSETEDV